MSVKHKILWKVHTNLIMDTKKHQTMADERKNNFKNLHLEYEEHFTLPKMEEIARNIKKRKDDAHTTSSIFDLFVPKAIKTFARIIGGENEQPEVPPHTGHSPHRSEPRGPGER